MAADVVPSRRPLPARAAAALVALLAAAAVVLPSGAAQAHARLIASDPASDATVDTAPTEVVLRFNEVVSTDFAVVQVTAPSGARVDAETPAVAGDHVTAGLLPLTEAGAHQVAYRVVSSDGHPIEGSFSFTVSDAAVAPPPAPEPATQAPVTEAPAPTEPATEPAPAPTATHAPEPAPTPSEAATELAAARGDTGIAPGLLVGIIAVLVVLAAVGVAVTRRGGGSDSAPTEPDGGTG